MAKAPLNVYKNGIYSHTIGKGLPGTPISMENIDTPTGGHWRRWGVLEKPEENYSGKNNCFFEAAFLQLDNSTLKEHGIDSPKDLRNWMADKMVKNPTLTHKMAEARSWLTERNKQMVMEGGASDGMGKEDPLDHRFLHGKHYDFDLPCDEKAFRQALAEKCAKNPAWQAYKAKGDDIGRRQIENELEKEAMQASLDFFQEVNERAAAAHQRLFMGVTRMGSYFIHPIFGVAYNNFLDKKVPVWDDTKAAYSYFGEGQYGQAACHAGMAALDATVIGKTGKGIWMGVRRWGGPKVGVPQSSKLPFDVDALLKNAAEPNRNGLTNAGRGLQKHADRFGEALSDIKFSGKTANRDAQKIIEEILKSPNRVIEPIIEKGGYRVYDSVTKQCFDVSRTGIFNGFRKAPGLDNIIK
jgi:hypothetical protein